MYIYKMRNLHIILLENDNVIVHLSEKTEHIDIFEECSQLYEFSKTNKPQHLIETIAIESFLEIDLHVKKYMQYYGIDHVRGGTYIEPILTTNQRNSLDSEFTIADVIRKQDVACKYSETNEKNKLLYALKYFYIKNEKFEISRETIHLVEWLKSTIRLSKTYAEYLQNNDGHIHMRYEEEIFKKYSRIMTIFKRLYQKIMIVRDSFDCDYPVYLENPELIFDNFMYYTSKSSTLMADYDTAIYMCGRYEFMCYILINRIDELEFDIANP